VGLRYPLEHLLRNMLDELTTSQAAIDPGATGTGLVAGVVVAIVPTTLLPCKYHGTLPVSGVKWHALCSTPTI
jgi:hypothetical protein